MVKKLALKMIAVMAEKSIKTANRTTCCGLTFQPKAPANIKKFKK